jgi:hypothetical protein
MTASPFRAQMRWSLTHANSAKGVSYRDAEVAARVFCYISPYHGTTISTRSRSAARSGYSPDRPRAVFPHRARSPSCVGLVSHQLSGCWRYSSRPASWNSEGTLIVASGSAVLWFCSPDTGGRRALDTSLCQLLKTFLCAREPKVRAWFHLGTNRGERRRR